MSGSVSRDERRRLRELPRHDAGAYLLRRVRDLWEEKAVVLVHEPADSELMRRWATHGEVHPVDATSSRLLLDGDSEQTLAGMLAELEADFVVEEPDSLRIYRREVAARLARAKPHRSAGICSISSISTSWSTMIFWASSRACGFCPASSSD
ncbi:WYL domain-containing protein [Georgenia wangjunii]|uniref:WYL domain-containing protein n=1 Tax=Georgenia wangjunii TaxID=3117730 RepID=UPI002F262A51